MNTTDVPCKNRIIRFFTSMFHGVTEKVVFLAMKVFLCHGMEASDKTIQQIKRAIKKIVSHYPPLDDDALLMTDIYLQVNQETGDFLAFDDDDNELNRCVIDDWINNTDETFFIDIQPILRRCLDDMRSFLLGTGIIKPFTITLTDGDRETFAELYIVDDNKFIIGDEIMKNVDEELDAFFEQLMKN